MISEVWNCMYSTSMKIEDNFQTESWVDALTENVDHSKGDCGFSWCKTNGEFTLFGF